MVERSLPAVDEDTERLCVRAAQIANVELAGVDLLLDRDGKAHLLEANFPTGFQSLGDRGREFSSAMVRHLMSKVSLGGVLDLPYAR